MKNRRFFRILSAFVFIAAVAIAEDLSEKQKEAVRASLNDFINQHTVNGSFLHYDAVEGKMLAMKFDGLHEGIKPAGTFFVSCVDFRDQLGRSLDVDLIVGADGAGFRTVGAVVHSVDETRVRFVDRQTVPRRAPALRKEQFARVVLNYLTELTAFTRRLTRTAADADDLLQSTYEQAFRSWRSLRSPASARAWLFRIARNLSIDQHRSEIARPELRLVESEGRVANQISPTQLERVDRIALGQALSRLSEEQAEAILLSDLWGFSYEEIAQIVGRPVGTVRSRISRGRSRLLELLSDTASRQGSFQR